MNVISCFAMTVSLLLTFDTAHAQLFISDFDSSRESWTVETRTNPTGAFTLQSVYTPTHHLSGGDSLGYIEQIDPDSNWSFFASPSSWSGDRSTAYGHYLEYSVRTSVQNYPDGRFRSRPATGASARRVLAQLQRRHKSSPSLDPLRDC